MTDTSQSAETVYEGRIFRLQKEYVTLPNRHQMHLDIIRHPGAAAIVPFLDEETVVLIQQYRHAVGGFIWEIPAGTLDHRESPLTCAQRELIEETGYAASEWQTLGEITPLPAYSDERIHLFKAVGLSKAPQKLDVDEILSIHPMPLKVALAMVFRSEIQDAKTIAGLFLASQ